MSNSFSQRHGFQSEPAEIRVRHGAPEELRRAVVQVAMNVGLTASDIRRVVCSVLLKGPDPNNWSPGNVLQEAQWHLAECKWFKVYEIIEALNADYEDSDRDIFLDDEHPFERQINEVFENEGIGWRMVDGQLQVRGDEPFEKVLRDAEVTLARTKRSTASNELHQAIQDLSHRPEPKVTGAIQHSMAALECLARDVCGDTLTLGKLLSDKKHSETLGIPKPLDIAVDKIWGFASERGRHLIEGRQPTYEEAELVVATCAALCRYLAGRSAPRST